MRWTKPIVFSLIVLAGAGLYVKMNSPGQVVNAPPRSGPIVAYGDSLTAGYGASGGLAYPEQLAAMIGRPVVNCGVSRETVAEAARRLQSDVLARQPSIVIVLLGGNDLLQMKNLDQSFAELETLVRAIQDEGAMVALVGLNGLYPMGGIRKRYARLAEETGCLYVPDILKGIINNPRLMSDQVHPNAEGYRVMAERIAKALGPWL